MSVQQFSAYDIVVDVVPGSVGLIAAVLLLPQPALSYVTSLSGVVSGITLLIGGFFFGRVVHSLSSTVPEYERLQEVSESYAHDDDDLDEDTSLTTRVALTLARFSPELGSLILLIQYVTGMSDNSNLEDWLRGTTDPPEDVDTLVVSRVRRSLCSKMGHPEGALPVHPSGMVKYGQNILFSRNTLYTKYEMLSTFFRNVSFLLFLFSLTSAIYALVSLTEPGAVLRSFVVSLPFSPTIYLVFSTAGFLLSMIARSRKKEFERRRDRAFIYDLHELLSD